MNVDPQKLKLGMIEEIDYDNNFFDFITFGAVFEHLYHPAKSLSKALQWLKPSGIIQIEVPSSDYFMSKVINSYYRLVGTNYVTNISPMHPPFHLYEFSSKSFQELSKRLNYAIILQAYQVGEIMMLPKMFHSILKKYMELTKTGMQLTVWLKKHAN
jgi:2-polyprenyl-3-methyl-5-hydroxy-6-metoxy-1,4-benzoquinol methylase